MPYKHIRNHFCRRDMVIGVGDGIGKVLEEIKEKYVGLEGLTFDGQVDAMARVYLKRELGAILIFDKKHVCGAAICHEVTHITNAFFQWMGVPLSDDTDEAYAYHNDMLFQIVVDALKEMKVKVKL